MKQVVTNPGSSGLAEEIMSLVIDRWNSKGAMSVLASIGIRLSQDARKELASESGSLKSFVKSHMQDRLRYMFFSSLTDCVAPLPQSANMTAEELLKGFNLTKLSETSPAALPGLRFKGPIWHAFTQRLGSGSNVRFLEKIDNNYRVIDDASQAREGANLFEIFPSELAFNEDGSRFTTQQAVAHISAWAARNGLNVDDMRTPTLPIEDRRPEAINDGQISSRVAFHLENLTQEELSRIFIPADIMFKLMKKI